MNDNTMAAQLRAFAARIESSPTDRAAIAGGFRLIAEALDPVPEKIAPEDNPETGAESDTVTGPGLEVA